MKKITAFTISLIMILTSYLSIAYATDANSISNVIVTPNSSNNQVTVQGSISTGSGKNVTFEVLDPDGLTVDYIGQTTSSQDGSFNSTFTVSSAVKDGNYTVKIGGDGISTPYTKTATLFPTTSTPTSNSTGGGSGTPTSVNTPVTITTDNNSNSVATISASSIFPNSINVIKVQEIKTDSGVKVLIPVGAMGTGTGSLQINTGSVILDIPIAVIDPSVLASGTTLQISKSVLASADSSSMLANVPLGYKSNGKVFSFTMDIYDSSNKLVKSIHDFASGKSVAVTLNLTSDDIKGLDTSKISAFSYDTTTNAWVDMGGSFNKTAMTYSFTTTHFTNFTILEKAGTSANVKRLAGANRIETSIAIAKEQYTDTKPDSVVLATANEFADALAGSGLAYKYNAPLILVNKTVSDSQTALDYITNNLGKDKNIYVLGETGAVSKEISDYLSGQGYKIIRLGGKDRYETNQKIVDNLNVASGTSLVIATGEGFADALSISSIADIKGYPVLLNGSDTLSANVRNDITNLQPTTVYIIGGTGVISSNVEAQIKGLNGTIKIVRLGGQDRYETSMMILDYFNLTTSTITVATGKDFPDALSGAVLAARKNSGVLLLDNKDTTKQKALLIKENVANVIVLGGEGVISTDIANSLIQR